MSKWQCCVCGKKCVFDMVDEQDGFRPVCCPVDNTSGIKPNWLPVDETATKCSQLPKLTAEVFDRPDCPWWAKWAAVDSFGNAVWTDDKFEPQSHIFSVFMEFDKDHIRQIPGAWDATDWQNSLIERPTKLPEWCKVGEWVYLSNAKYYKIEKVDSYGIILANGIVIKTDDIHAEAVSARIRPYNAEEMKALMGKVIKKGPSMHIVTGFENVFGNECMVHVNGCLYSANDLLRQFYIDNAPCGFLEHLENGEWVK